MNSMFFAPSTKPSTWRALTLALLALVAATGASHAADIVKADNLDNLNLNSSWTNGTAPTASDVAVWDATVATAVPQALSLGGISSWGGVRIVDPAGAVTLGLNAAAITATASSATLTYTVAPVNPFVNDDRVALAGTTAPGGFTFGTVYFVVNATATTFQLATTSGGAAIVASTTGTAVNATGGSTLTLGASGIDTSGGSQFLTFPGAVVSGAAQNWNLLQGVTIIGGLSGAGASGNDVTLTGSGTLTIGGRGMSLSNLVVNSGIVSISAGGAGIVALNGGTFNVNGAINEGLLVMAGGGIEQNTGGNRTWSGNLSGSGPLTVIASSTHTWTGNHSNYSGTLTLQGGGALRLSSASSVNAATTYIFNGGTMNPNTAGPFNLGSLAGTSGFLNPGTGRDFAVGFLNTDTTFGGVIGGAGNLIKMGTGTLILSGANTFSGATVISNGVVQIDDGSGTGKFGSGSVNNLTQLVFNRGGNSLLVPNVITGSGSVTNIGSSKVSLTGANTYTGPTIISAGTLAVGSASAVTSDYTVADGATLGAVITSAGATVTESNVTFGTGCSYEFDLGTFGNPTGTVVTNTGNISLAGNVTVNLLGTNFSTGTITLLRYTSRSGAGSFVLGTLPSNVSATLNDDQANNQLQLTITSVFVGADMTFRWVGDTAGVWDIDNPANQIWQVVGTAQVTNYTEGAAVLFDDTATGTTNIDLIVSVNPSTVTVNNTNKIYTLGGIGSVTGATGLTKKGPGTLIVTNANSYAGLTVIEAGSLRVAGETGAIGGGGVTNNGALILDRTEATNALPNTLLFSGQITGTGSLAVWGIDNSNSIVEMQIATGDGNPYSGGTTLSNTFVRLNANPASDATRSAAKSTGLGSGQITFVGDSILELEDFGVGNASAQFGNFSAALNVPAGQAGTFRTGGRMTVSSALTGNGTFNLVVSYIRCVISGNFSAFTGQVNVSPSPNGTGNQYQIANAAGLPLAKVHLAAGVSMGGQQGLNNGDVVPIGELSADAGSFVNVVGENARTVVFRVGGLDTSSTFAGEVGGGHSWIKVGTGTFTLAGTNNDFSGTTTISNGVLALVGESGISNSPTISISSPGILDVAGRNDGTFALGAGAANQVLRGDGTLRGSLSVGSLGTVSPGFSIGILTVTNAVTLGGAASFELDRAAATNSDRIVAPAIAAGGTLTVTNIGVALQAGDTFQLFSTAVTGSFAAVNLPTNDVSLTTYTWTNKLAIDGTIAVLTAVPPAPPVNTTPTNIISSFAGGNLTLSWPADHTGWTLQVQTNTRAVGLNTNWFNIDGSSATNEVTVPVGLDSGTVFYRLVYP